MNACKNMLGSCGKGSQGSILPLAFLCGVVCKSGKLSRRHARAMYAARCPFFVVLAACAVTFAVVGSERTSTKAVSCSEREAALNTKAFLWQSHSQHFSSALVSAPFLSLKVVTYCITEADVEGEYQRKRQQETQQARSNNESGSSNTELKHSTKGSNHAAVALSWSAGGAAEEEGTLSTQSVCHCWVTAGFCSRHGYWHKHSSANKPSPTAQQSCRSN